MRYNFNNPTSYKYLARSIQYNHCRRLILPSSEREPPAYTPPDEFVIDVDPTDPGPFTELGLWFPEPPKEGEFDGPWFVLEFPNELEEPGIVVEIDPVPPLYQSAKRRRMSLQHLAKEIVHSK